MKPINLTLLASLLGCAAWGPEAKDAYRFKGGDRIDPTHIDNLPPALREQYLEAESREVNAVDDGDVGDNDGVDKDFEAAPAVGQEVIKDADDHANQAAQFFQQDQGQAQDVGQQQGDATDNKVGTEATEGEGKSAAPADGDKPADQQQAADEAADAPKPAAAGKGKKGK